MCDTGMAWFELASSKLLVQCPTHCATVPHTIVMLYLRWNLMKVSSIFKNRFYRDPNVIWPEFDLFTSMSFFACAVLHRN